MSIKCWNCGTYIDSIFSKCPTCAQNKILEANNSLARQQLDGVAKLREDINERELEREQRENDQQDLILLKASVKRDFAGLVLAVQTSTPQSVVQDVISYCNQLIDRDKRMSEPDYPDVYPVSWNDKIIFYEDLFADLILSGQVEPKLLATAKRTFFDTYDRAEAEYFLEIEKLQLQEFEEKQLQKKMAEAANAESQNTSTNTTATANFFGMSEREKKIVKWGGIIVFIFCSVIVAMRELYL